MSSHQISITKYKSLLTQDYPNSHLDQCVREPVFTSLAMQPETKGTSKGFSFKQNVAMYLQNSAWLGVNLNLSNMKEKNSKINPYLAFYSPNKNSFIKVGNSLRKKQGSLWASFFKRDADSEFFLSASTGEGARLKGYYLNNIYGGIAFKHKKHYKLGYMLKRQLNDSTFAELSIMLGYPDKALKADTKVAVVKTIDSNRTVTANFKMKNNTNIRMSFLQRFNINNSLFFFFEMELINNTIIDWIGFNYSVFTFKIPFNFTDFDNLLFKLCFALGSSLFQFYCVKALTYAKKRFVKKTSTKKKKEFEKKLKEKESIDLIIKQKIGRVSQNRNEKDFSVLRAFVIRNEDEGKFRQEAEGFDQERLKILVRQSDCIDITYTCRLYTIDSVLSLPPRKDKLIGFIKPFNSSVKDLSICLFYKQTENQETLYKVFPLNQRIHLP